MTILLKWVEEWWYMWTDEDREKTIEFHKHKIKNRIWIATFSKKNKTPEVWSNDEQNQISSTSVNHKLIMMQVILL